MSNIKKQNSNGEWDVLASGKATGITVTNPKLLQEGETIDSVDGVLEKHQDAIDKLQHNVSWLAKHGGGGSGGSGGGGGSNVTEATCDITVNDQLTGNDILIDENGLKISLTNISAKVTKPWNVTVRIGATQIASTVLSFTANTFYLSLSKVSPYLTNHTGNLTIGASYEDETNGIYGSASWSGTVLEAVVNVKTSNYSFNLDKLDTAQLVYNYSVGIVGAYTMTIVAEKNGAELVRKEIPVTINSTSAQVKTIDLNNILPTGMDSAQIVGVYNITTTLSYDANPLVQGSTKSTITIVSDDILIASTVMSESQDKPTEVSLSASINVVFTAYLQGATTFKYNLKIANTIVKQDTIGYFGTEVNEYIPVNGDWAVENAVVPLVLTVSSGEKTVEKTYYIKFVKATDTFLSISNTSRVHLISEMLARNYNTGESKFDLIANGYEQGGSSYDLTSVLQTINGNDLSTITKLSNGLPYLRLSNGAYASLGSFKYNNRTFTLPNLIVTNAFTMSICFKADYHPDDNRTILFCGSTDAVTGTLTSGISIDAHDIYINNRSVAKLTDESINSVDITCQKVIAKDINDKGEEITYNTFIIKVYVDGVLTAVTKEASFPSLSDKIYFGGRIAGNKSTYLCDCNIYNFQLYDTALTDFDIMINYINNKVSTSYINNQPNFSIITEELKTNFCERASDGSVTSYMFKNGEYTIDFLLDGSSHLDVTKLNNYAKVLGIPIMLIDVSTDANWTFDAFVTQQTAGNVSLPETSGRTIQYWDPNGDNTSVINITNASVKLQGTSTLSDSVKNLNITVPEDTVFIPKDTWFPEQTYTLKADVVDSSHSNNAAIGGFINEKLGYDEQTGAFFPFDKNAIDNVYTANYKKKQQPTVTLKHTVEGFPVFLIMKFNTNTSSTISVTPLGIYSFNIGRDAYRNLGFKKVNSISDSVGDTPEIKTFPYILERARINETESDANWIEIKDTTSIKDLIEVTNALPENFDCSKGDFWQDDASILNARYEVRFGNKTVPSQYENFKTFVKNIMSLPIEGCSTTDVLGNRDQSQITGSYDKYQVDNKSNYTKTGLKNEFVTDSNSLPANLGFNADSFYKYFVIGLLFGLIDNFGKNSTYRSWLGGQYYIDFYDLDCALKGDNQGDLSVTPDLWIKYLYNSIQKGKNYGYVCESFDLNKTYVGEGSSRRQTGSGTVVSANHNKLWLSLDTPFFRGYSGDTSNSVYTKYWYQLREKMDELASAAGYDNFADYFIDEFYIKQTKSCGPLLFNYDYKLKYLLQFRGNEYNTTKDLSKLHGRKIAVARDWLKKHISFMDSLFYWRDNGQTLNFKNDLDSRGSNTVLNTPESLPMVSNTPLLIYNSVGDSAKTFYFMQTNMKTYVNTAGNSSNSPLTWNFSNSPNIIEFGDSETPLSSMNIKILSSTPNSRNLNSIGYPSITDLLLGNNRSFASSFSLESFSKAKVSELRTIDLSNTSGESFTLNLVNTASDGSTYTKFSKLTSINVGNSSCVSNITIPTIPLNDLVLVNSSITNFNLANQKYITGVDLTGCNRLRTIEINKCDSYKELRVSNLANLETVKIVSCASISSIVITNCPLLRTVNIEYCDKLTTIQINSCKSLVGGTSDNYIRVANCNNINSLDLGTNLNLKKVSIDGCDRTKIETLKIHQTNITDVSSSTSLNGNMKLDLTEFPQLKTFTCYYNKSVKYIAFANNQNAPIPITDTFQECSNLERIYGCVELSNALYSGNYGLFRGCSKFSIHGVTTTTWKGKSIKKGAVWCTPWELLRANPSEYNTVTWAETFTTGPTATNIRFANKSSQLESLFRGTALTQFDVYYILCVLALSNVTISQSASFTFREITPAMFDWSTGNQPNRYMFYGCSMIISFEQTFSINEEDSTENVSTFLYSPSVENGVVIADDGLFSPLINLTSAISMFGNIVCSKYLFHRKNGTYPIINLFYENVTRIYDSDKEGKIYSNMSDTSFLMNNYSKIGNYDGFFDYMPNIRNIHSFGSGEFINFSKLVIPTTVTQVIGSFKSNSGQGTMDLRKIFTAGSQCTEIIGSFIVSSSTLGKVKFPIANNTFTNLKNLISVGYNSTIDGGGSEIRTSFMGNGLDKYIEGSTFPINIVSSLPNLEIFSGFFRDVRGDLSSPPAIPGKMFENNTKLRDVSSLMYNASIQFTLSGDGFKNCPNLTNVAYFCYHDVTSNANNRSKLTGSIPYHMFYHGTNGNENKVFRGTNQVTKPDETFDMKNLLSETLTFPIIRRNITNMTKCFYGCVNLESYSMSTQDVESNPDYSPFKWMYNEQNDSWYEGTDSRKVDASWSYDGASAQTSDYRYLDTGADRVTINVLDKVETLHYMCPPDLFRYCANLNSTKIQGVFENCGLNYSVGTGGWINVNEDYYSAGITGRIPPYLLRPLSNITDISYMFKNCKRLSSYTKDSLVYQIPKDFFSYAPKIISLVETFQGLAFIPNTNLTVFGALTNALDIRCIMQSCIWGKDNVPWNISDIFGTNTIARISGAFSMKDLYINNNVILGVYVPENRIINIPNSTTMGSNFGTNSTKVPAPTATGYVYYLWGSKAKDSLIKNENSNYNN